MNPLIQPKRTTRVFLVALLLTCFGFLPRAQAVITDPEGYFPGWNTAEGQSALFSLTTGLYNTALGGAALYSNTRGTSNTAVGVNALFHNATGFNNTALGVAALHFNTSGEQNTATGYAALRSNTSGDQNTANGYQALYFNTTGTGNAGYGFQALYHGGGFFNTAIGPHAGSNLAGRERNTLIGYAAGYGANGGGGNENTAIGYGALYNGWGGNNTAIGSQALYNNNGGSVNTAIGNRALYNNGMNGNGSTAIGTYALHNNTTGHENTAVGDHAGSGITTAHHVICIGADVSGLNVNNSCYIGSIFGQASFGGAGVFINSSGKLGTVTSSRRFKEKIKPMERASERLLSLKPVVFRYKKEIEPAGTSQFGLVAEDVEKVNPDLVVRDKEGKPYSVRYEQINAMLLNEFLKEHRKVQELEATVADLAATMKEQSAQIQKVSAQLEASKPVPQVVNNP
jgi:trimeric autotransporter adhesin